MTEGSTPAGSAGLDRARVAELIVTHPGGDRRGSGYRVTATGVLTAAHVLEDASAVRVRFVPDLPGRWETPASSWWVDPGSDLAVISIDPVSITAKPGEAPLSPARFGRLRAEAAVLSVQAVGFPAWKMRNRDGTAPLPGDGKDKYRDACHAVGSAPVLSNSREGTLEIVVAPPGNRPAAGSPWVGMSGAPVWVGDRIVGVLSSQHPGDGLGRLAAARLDLALDGLDPDRRAELRTLLPTLPAQLPDVVPLASGQLALTAYQNQLPPIDQLRDRDRELDQLVAFCAGERAYDWWQAGPWAGKSALLSWFVLHPPAGVDVVSFFITSRFAGQSDSAAYTEALIEQLAALAGESPREALDSRGSRPGHAVRLLKNAAQRAEEAGRRLLLVVDGLDEDTSVESGLPSIASLLPRRPPPGVRILVAGRLHPELPYDVAGDHTLRTLIPRRLEVSPHARDEELAAKRELSALLSGPELPREIIGLILASGGGLTGRDLQDLTKRAPYELDRLFNGALGRSIERRVSASVGRAAERVYLFAHDTLRQIAQQQYGVGVATYRDRLHAWAEHHRSQGWPANTPTYLLRGYPRMLTEIGDTKRLLACATDPARHARLLELTGGDALALTEITTTANLITRQPAPDLAALILLAMARDDLAQRNNKIPVELPAAWITLNQPARATALAYGIPDAETRATALTFMITAASKTGKHDLIPQLATDTERIARDLTNPWQRANALSSLVTACTTAGEHDRAERIARDLTDPGERADALSSLVAACAPAGEHNHAERIAIDAERIARDLTDPGERADALSSLVAACTTAGEHDRAERIARDLTDPWQRADALSSLVAACAMAGEHDRAERIAIDAECIARDITNPRQRANVLLKLVAACATAGEHDRAERIARDITDPWQRTDALSKLVAACATAGEHDRAERIARDITNPRQRANVLLKLVVACATAGEHDRGERIAIDAERIAHESTDPRLRADVLFNLVAACATAGEHDRAERIAPDVTNPRLRAGALIRLVAVCATAGEHDRAGRIAIDAERIARDITEPWLRADALLKLVAACATAGEHDRAGRIAIDAERIARDITDPWLRTDALTRLVAACATAGEHDRAERIARDITGPRQRADALSKLVAACATAGEHDRVERIARDITDPRQRVAALTQLAGALIGLGQGQDRIRARELVVELLGDENWQPALDLVARLEPAALRGVCDVVLARSAAEAVTGRDNLPGAE